LSKTAVDAWSDPAGVTGWTQVGSYTNTSLVTTVWVKALAAGDPGATVSFTNSSFSHASVNLAVYSGVSATNPVVTSAQAKDSAAATHTTPTITAAGGNWVVSFWSDRSTATRTWTTPAAVSTRDASTDTGSLTVQAVIADSGGAVSAGPYGALTATTDANTDRAAMWTIELRSS
jgi:hypothetical protein